MTNPKIFSYHEAIDHIGRSTFNNIVLTSSNYVYEMKKIGILKCQELHWVKLGSVNPIYYSQRHNLTADTRRLASATLFLLYSKGVFEDESNYSIEFDVRSPFIDSKNREVSVSV